MPMPAARMVMTKRGGCIGESIRRLHQHNVATDWDWESDSTYPYQVLTSLLLPFTLDFVI